MKTFYGIIQNGKLTLPTIQKELRRQFLASLKDGARVKETLTRESLTKTHQQVKAYFGLVVEMIRQKFIEMGVDVCGIAPNKEMIHEILKRACGGVGEQGEVMGLSSMSISQVSKFFENCQTWSATQLNLYIPEPDKDWRRKEERKGR